MRANVPAFPAKETSIRRPPAHATYKKPIATSTSLVSATTPTHSGTAPTSTVEIARSPEEEPVSQRVEHLTESGDLIEVAGDIPVDAVGDSQPGQQPTGRVPPRIVRTCQEDHEQRNAQQAERRDRVGDGGYPVLTRRGLVLRPPFSHGASLSGSLRVRREARRGHRPAQTATAVDFHHGNVAHARSGGDGAGEDAALLHGLRGGAVHHRRPRRMIDCLDTERKLRLDIASRDGSRRRMGQVSCPEGQRYHDHDRQSDHPRDPVPSPAPGLDGEADRILAAHAAKATGPAIARRKLAECPPEVWMLTEEDRTSKLEELNQLIDVIRPAVQADGGDIVLLSADVDTGVVEVQLQGSCSSCAISSTTLQAGVERILKERLDWITEVFGSVDEEMDLEASAAMGRGGYTPRW